MDEATTRAPGPEGMALRVTELEGEVASLRAVVNQIATSLTGAAGMLLAVPIPAAD